MTSNPGQSCLFVIFGSTGDLSRRKLLPALCDLSEKGLLPAHFAVAAIGRREKSDDQYRIDATAAITEARRAAGRTAPDAEKLNELLRHIFYRQVGFVDSDAGYGDLQVFLDHLDEQYGTQGNRLFFLAVAPEFFGPILQRLARRGMLANRGAWQRVMIEKPFGSNLATARDLNRTITAILPEEKVFRIDHYLGKEMIQNILAIRFGNSLFEPLWNHHYIDNIQILSSETIGIEGRGSYYEKTGARRDMLQSHLLQMLSLIAMEPPVDLSAEAIRNEKVKVLRALRSFNHANSTERDALSAGRLVSGQYGPGVSEAGRLPGYREEKEVLPDSATDTFIALKACVDNFRWAGVPFYIKAGKRLDRQFTRIVIEFRKLPGIEFYQDFQNLQPNLLVVEVQPQEGLFFQINAKRPGNVFAMERVELNYCQSSQFPYNSPEAYERLILEAMRNNSALFTCWDELELSWQFVDGLEDLLKEQAAGFPNYAAGSRGPQAADHLVKDDGRQWWEFETVVCT